MESSSKIAIVVTIITVLGTIVVALISKYDGTPTKDVVCEQIPAVEQLKPQPKKVASIDHRTEQPKHPNNKTLDKGYVWVPTDFEFSSGKFEVMHGHWKRRRADGKNKYIPGHWETGTGNCVWIRGEFVEG